MPMLGKLFRIVETETGISSLQACTVSSAGRITASSPITIPFLQPFLNAMILRSDKVGTRDGGIYR